MKETNSYQRQHLDKLLHFFEQNTPRPQQSFAETVARVQELLPAVYAEITENLQPLDLLALSDYKFWISRQFSEFRTVSWKLRVQYELHPPDEEAFPSKDSLEKDGFRLDRIFPEEPFFRVYLLEDCHDSLEFLQKTEKELNAFLVNSEDMALELEELQTAMPEMQVTYAKSCAELWEPINLEKADAAIMKACQTKLDRMEVELELLLQEIDLNAAGLSPDLQYRYLLRLYNSFSHSLEAWFSQETPPNIDLDKLFKPETLLENLFWMELPCQPSEYQEEVISFLAHITAILDEKLGELDKELREEEPLT